MNKLNMTSHQRFLFVSLLVVVLLALVGGLLLSPGKSAAPAAATSPHIAALPTNAPISGATLTGASQGSNTVIPAEAALAQRIERFADFQLRPFAASRASANYGWTAEDGREPAVVRKLAHNELECDRMNEESSRIYRRQLVYATRTADLLVQQSRLSGQPVRQLVLPGLDGQEILFEVTASDLSPSGQSGTFTGQIAGQPDSIVTLAFKGGRQAFTILAPSAQLYLVGDPREPGQLIVKSINPDTYIVGTCGNE